MSRNSRLALLGCSALAGSIAIAASPRVEQKVTGPVATYWMSAATSTGLNAGMMGGGGRPGMGDVMRMMRGGGGQAQHSLNLQLGSTQKAADPAADHLPGSLAPLPLLTPRVAPAAPAPAETVEEQPTMTERPRGRMLLFWGCGEHAGPGQPYVIDFSKIGPGQPLPRFPFIPVHHQNPPSAGRFATYGEWPNSRSRQAPPPSLTGEHRVHGNYSPDIRFTLPHDYMAPLAIDTSRKTASGATLLSWQPISGATGYFATFMGASANGRDDATIVMWSSSGIQTFAGGGLLDYLAPAEVRRLIAQKVAMPPSQTQCAMPAEATTAAPTGMVSMIAYGEEADFADPPRPADPRTPWNINWTVKVRYKSTTGAMLGMPQMGGREAMSSGDRDEGAATQPPPAEPKKKRGGLLGKIKDAAEAAGAIPH